MFPIYQIVFYIFAIILIASAILVIMSKQPVRSVLYLVLCFVASSVLWMMLQSEFLSLVLIFVYVGAVMTLFLFVVMMLNLDLSKQREKFIRFLPVGILAFVLLVAIMVYTIVPKHMPMAGAHLVHYAVNYSNTQQMGSLLYTDYLLPFEIAGLILLVAMIAAITLAFYGRKPGTKAQNMAEQHKVNAKDRIRVIDMKGEQS